MNTNMVASELGVSAKTVQRWVKQLNLPAERNELGHYSFTAEDVQILKSVQKQISEGTALQDINVPRSNKKRTGFLVQKQTVTQRKDSNSSNKSWTPYYSKNRKKTGCWQELRNWNASLNKKPMKAYPISFCSTEEKSMTFLPTCNQ